MALFAAGLEPESLRLRIAAEPCGYDLSPEGLLQLLDADVPPPVISAMVARCSESMRGPAAGGDGIALAEPAPNIGTGAGLRPLLVHTLKPGLPRGDGSLLFPRRLILQLPGPAAAALRVRSQPVFLRAEEHEANYPSTLVRLHTRKAAREIEVGRATALSSRDGPDPDDVISVVRSRVGDQTSMTPEQPLGPGEYAWLVPTDVPGQYRVYPFGVD